MHVNEDASNRESKEYVVAPISGDFKGIVPPVVTPFTDDDEVDVASLERVVRFLLDGGVHGLFALGSTSETALLTDRQRATVIETIVSVAAGQVPVLAGVIDMSTARSIEHAQVADRLGVDGLVLTAPYYVRPGVSEIKAHFQTIHEAVGLPILAYDIPFAVQTKLDRWLVLAMAKEGLIVGLKDSSGDEANFRALVAEARQTVSPFATFTGSELVVDLALIAGASGCVPGLGNVDPAGYVRLYDLVHAGDLAAARCEQERLIRLFAIIGAGSPERMGFSASALGGFKTALVLRGVIGSNKMGRPLNSYNAEEIAKVQAILQESGLL